MIIFTIGPQPIARWEMSYAGNVWRQTAREPFMAGWLIALMANVKRILAGAEK